MFFIQGLNARVCIVYSYVVYITDKWLLHKLPLKACLKVEVKAQYGDGSLSTRLEAVVHVSR